MTQAASTSSTIPTTSPQPSSGRAVGAPGGRVPCAQQRAGFSRAGPAARPPGAAARSSSSCAASPCTRNAMSTAAGGRSGGKTASESSAKRQARRNWPPGTDRRAERRPGRADGQHRRLQRAAVGRTRRPHHLPGRPGRRGITVDRKVVEVTGRLFLEAPAGRSRARQDQARLGRILLRDDQRPAAM
jgi:hypothetical protein